MERLTDLFTNQVEYSAMIVETAIILAAMSGNPVDRITVSIKWLSLENGFKQKVEKKLAY